MSKDCNSGCDSWLFSLSPCELTLLATAVALVLSEGIDGCQRAVLGNFILSVGQNIVTFDAQESCLKQ